MEALSLLPNADFSPWRQSDHPVVNSRYLLNEAAVAFYYGLPSHLALASVTTTPAKAAGLDHRIGYIKLGLFNWWKNGYMFY